MNHLTVFFFSGYFFGFYPFFEMKKQENGFFIFFGFFSLKSNITQIIKFWESADGFYSTPMIFSTPAAGYYSTPNMFRRLRQVSIAHLKFFNACDGLLYYDTPKILRRLRRASIVQSFFDVYVLLLWYT